MKKLNKIKYKYKNKILKNNTKKIEKNPRKFLINQI